jgi:predicted PurR-regulated permease PerM
VPLAQSRALLRDLLLVAAVGASVWVAHRLGRIVLVLVLAMFFAYVIAPLVDLVQRPVALRGRVLHLTRGAAIAVVYLVLAGAAGAGTTALWPSATRQLNEAIASAPMYTEEFRVWEHGWTRYYERLRIPLELRHSIDESVLGAGDAAVGYAHGALLALFGVLSDIPWLMLVPVLAFLLLKDAAAIRRTLVLALPHRVRLRGHRLFEELNATLASYVRAQLIACVIVGTLCGIGLAALGNPYAILLGILAAVCEFVPLIGPIVVATVAMGNRCVARRYAGRLDGGAPGRGAGGGGLRDLPAPHRQQHRSASTGGHSRSPGGRRTRWHRWCLHRRPTRRADDRRRAPLAGVARPRRREAVGHDIGLGVYDASGIWKSTWSPGEGPTLRIANARTRAASTASPTGQAQSLSSFTQGSLRPRA